MTSVTYRAVTSSDLRTLAELRWQMEQEMHGVSGSFDDYAAAYAWQALTVQRGYTHLLGEPRGKAAAVEALALARRAVELDSASSLCLGTLGFVLLLNAEWDEALEMGRAAVCANPRVLTSVCGDDAGAAYYYGWRFQKRLKPAGIPGGATALAQGCHSIARGSQLERNKRLDPTWPRPA